MSDRNKAWCDTYDELTRHFDYGDRHKCEVCSTFNYTDKEINQDS